MRGRNRGYQVSAKVSRETTLLLVEEKTYSGRVVRLAEVTVDTTRGGGVDNAAVLLFQEVWPCCFGNRVSTSEMDVRNDFPQVVIHIRECFVA